MNGGISGSNANNAALGILSLWGSYSIWRHCGQKDLKAYIKEKKLSTNFEKCVICQENKKTAKLSKATSAEQNSGMLASEARRD